jgi:hypothetical protein
MAKIFKRNAKSNDDTYLGINLGDKVKDTITGLEGVVLARAEYLTGCSQVNVQPLCDSTNEVKTSYWFDVERIESLEVAAVKVGARYSGMDVTPPNVNPTNRR